MAISEAQYRKILANHNSSASVTHPPDSDRVLAGETSRQAGHDFEEMIDRQGKLYLSSGRLAHFIKQMPPMRSVFKDGALCFVALGPGPCDRVFVTPSALFGIFDCKSVDNPKQFTWNERQGHQLEELRKVHDITGGRSPAFSLVYWRQYEEVRVHPISGIAERTVYRADGHLITGTDWLPCVESLWSL